MSKKNISSAGEFAFIEMIKERFSEKNKKNVSVNIGDDCFCFKSGGKNICITKDMLAQDVHFKKEWISPRDLGRKAVEVNVSDIAAMGNVKPEYVFIGLGCPAQTPLKYLSELYAGIKEACAKYGMFIAGGDTIRADKIVISVTAIGSAKSLVVRRKGAKKGDLIGVTGTFGDAGAGVALLYKYGAKHKFTKDEKYLVSKQNNPRARLEEAGKIAKYATSMTDASDGLDISVKLLADESEKGASVYLERVPLSKQLKNVFKSSAKRIEFAMFGAEDFELVFTANASDARIIKKLVPSVSFIGIIDNSKKVKYFKDGKEEKTKAGGFKHF